MLIIMFYIHSYTHMQLEITGHYGTVSASLLLLQGPLSFETHPGVCHLMAVLEDSTQHPLPLSQE